VKVNRSQSAKQRRLASALGEIGFALPGSLTVRAYRCGKQSCRCRGEPPQLHGPYAFWTRKIDGKTVTRMLSNEEVADYQSLFDNARKLRELMSELHELSLQLVDPADARSHPKPGTKPAVDAVNPSRRPKAAAPQE
jgi:hypothetical protein